MWDRKSWCHLGTSCVDEKDIFLVHVRLSLISSRHAKKLEPHIPELVVGKVLCHMEVKIAANMPPAGASTQVLCHMT